LSLFNEYLPFDKLTKSLKWRTSLWYYDRLN
jgi:hypothetical protein